MGLFGKKKRIPQAVEVKGNPLVCQVCKNDEFFERKIQLNTRAATLFKLDWANRSATCFICSNCTHIYWFEG